MNRDGPSGSTTHGRSKTRAYRAWARMLQRCYNPNTTHFERWGGRGITVCRRWRESFESFHEDMGECPPGLSLERVNNNGAYTPKNYRWATAAEQAANRSSTRFLRAFGEDLPLKAWAAKVGLKRLTLTMRLKRGWPLEKALTAEVRRWS